MVRVLGLDIGGVNIKIVLLETGTEAPMSLKTKTKFFPIWKHGREKLQSALEELRDEFAGSAASEAVAVTLTAELSDVYQTKREGVNHVLNCVEQVFSGKRIYVLDVDVKLRTVAEARAEPIKVAAANWCATGWLASKLFENCVVVDVGSTTTSIVPVVNGRVNAEGKTDLEKLCCGELVYTGSLRTNIAAIASEIPVGGKLAKVSSELFALSGDVHLILGNISEEEYTTETADGRGRTRFECMARLSRVVCSDIEALGEAEISAMAKYIYDKQLSQIVDGLKQVYGRVSSMVDNDVPVAVTGIGREFLAKKAAKRVGCKKIIDLSMLVGSDASKALTSVSLAQMLASLLEGRDVLWKL